jgi:UDP-N-acetylbacillosamine transaminase
MSNVLAAIGVAQMEVLDARIKRRREIFALYQEAFANMADIQFMPEIDRSTGNRWLTTITLEKREPLKIIEALERDNIESRPLWKPMHLQPLFQDALVVEDGTSEKLFERGLCLPSGSSMSDEAVARVCKSVKKALR